MSEQSNPEKGDSQEDIKISLTQFYQEHTLAWFLDGSGPDVLREIKLIFISPWPLED